MIIISMHVQMIRLRVRLIEKEAAYDTIHFIYLNDVREGGETDFPKLKNLNQKKDPQFTGRI